MGVVFISRGRDFGCGTSKYGADIAIFCMAMYG